MPDLSIRAAVGSVDWSTFLRTGTEQVPPALEVLVDCLSWAPDGELRETLRAAVADARGGPGGRIGA